MTSRKSGTSAPNVLGAPANDEPSSSGRSHLRPRLAASEELIEIFVGHEVQIFAIREAGALHGHRRLIIIIEIVDVMIGSGMKIVLTFGFCPAIMCNAGMKAE